MAAGRDVHALGVQAQRLGARGDRGPVRPSPPARTMAAAYAAAATLVVVVALLFGRDPTVCDGWIGARGAASHLLSLGLGLPLGAATIAATRIAVRRSGWGHALHAALRPSVHGADEATILAVATASSACEELVFRGLLVPWIGVVASSLFFGALHQIRGRARWGWMLWAAAMGVLFGSVFAATGSLAGPFVAHAAINRSNLRFLRDNDPDLPPRALGGLLRR